MDEPRDEELAALVSELETTLTRLQSELSERDSRRRAFGLPAPPSPRELLTFTGEYAIPTAIAALEANVRALEMLQRALTLANPERAVREEGGRVGDRAARAGRETVKQLEGALDRLDRELQEGSLPANPEARDVIQDARRLNEEIADWLTTSRTDADRAEPEPDDDTEEVTIDIDVEEEIQAIKDDVNGREDDPDAEESDDDAS